MQKPFEGKQTVRTIFSVEEVQARVHEMGCDIGKAYSDRDHLIVLGVLKGSFIFLADLVRCIPISLQVDFLITSSYGGNKVSSNELQLLYIPTADLTGRAVLIVEDIVDSGTTLNELIPLLEAYKPRSIEVCALLHKRVAKIGIPPRWVGFDAPDKFLVGYGLDHAEDFRHLPYIASL